MSLQAGFPFVYSVQRPHGAIVLLDGPTRRYCKLASELDTRATGPLFGIPLFLERILKARFSPFVWIRTVEAVFKGHGKSH